MMYEMMIGFMILEERDENILSYLFVTPLSKAEYILYRTGLAMIMSTAFNIFFFIFLTWLKSGYSGLCQYLSFQL